MFTYFLLIFCSLNISLFATSEINNSHFDFLPTTDKTTTRVYLVKQGQSTATVYFEKEGQKVRYVSGQSPTVSLTDYGKEQMKCLALNLSKKFSKNTKLTIVNSSLLRTKQSAVLIYNELLQTHPFVNLVKESFPGLNERSLGNWEGQLKDNQYKNALCDWSKKSAQDKYNSPEVEGAESYSLVAKRAINELEKIAKLYPDTTVIAITSTVTMNALQIEVNQLPLSTELGSNLPKVKIDNGDLLLLEISKLEGLKSLNQTISIKNSL